MFVTQDKLSLIISIILCNLRSLYLLVMHLVIIWWKFNRFLQISIQRTLIVCKFRTWLLELCRVSYWSLRSHILKRILQIGLKIVTSCLNTLLFPIIFKNFYICIWFILHLIQICLLFHNQASLFIDIELFCFIDPLINIGHSTSIFLIFGYWIWAHLIQIRFKLIIKNVLTIFYLT